MVHAKLANGSGHKLPIGHAPSPAEQKQMNAAARSTGKKVVRKKTAPRKTQPARPLRKETVRKSKSDKLVCRYCGSDDLSSITLLRVTIAARRSASAVSIMPSTTSWRQTAHVMPTIPVPETALTLTTRSCAA